MLYEFSYLHLTPYILLYLLCIYNVVNYDKHIYKLSFVVILLFSALRYGIGYDYFNYIEIINEYDINRFSFYEWLSQLIYFVSQNTFDQMYFIINSILCLYPIYLISKKKSNKPGIILFSFMMIPLFYLESLSIIRFSSALSIALLSYFYLENKKYFIYLILCIISGGLHTSGYFALSFIILRQIKSSHRMNIIIFILSGYFHFFPVSNILDLLPAWNNIIYLKLFGYISNSQAQSGLMSIVLYFIGLYNLFFWKRIAEISHSNLFYLRFFNLGLLFWGFFSFNITLSLRISSYLLIFIILVIPSYIALFDNKKRSIFLTYTFLSIFYLSSFFVNIIGYSPSLYKRMSTLPYQTVLYYKDYQNYKYRFQ